MLIFFTSIATIIFSSVMYYLERGTYDSELGLWKRLLYYDCPVTIHRPGATWESGYLDDFLPNSYMEGYECRLLERIDEHTARYSCPYLYPKNNKCTHIYEQR